MAAQSPLDELARPAPPRGPRSTESSATAVALLGAASLCAVIFTIDLFTPLGFAVWILYLLPILIVGRSPHVRWPFAAAALCTILLWVGFWISPRGVPARLAAENRLMGMAAGWGAAWIVTRRMKAEIALRRTYEVFRDIVATAPIGVFTLDLDGRVRTWNVAAQALFGWRADEVIGQPVPLPVSNEQRDRLLAVMRSGEPLVRAEVPSQRKDGALVTVLTSAAPLRDEAGRVIGGIATALDVGELRRAEADQRRLASRLTAILESVSDGFVALDREWRYSYINRRGAEFFGRRPEDLIGKHIWTEFPEGVGQPFHKAYERVMAGGAPETFEDYYAPWDRWFENRVYPTPEGIAILYQEITERKRAEQALRDYAERLRLVVEGTSIGLWDWDLRTNHVWFSPEWKRQIGYADAEVPNEFAEWESRVHPEDLATTLARVRAYIANPVGVHETEFRFRHKDGTWRLIVAQGIVQRDADGRPIRMLGSHLDITERRRTAVALLTIKQDFSVLFEQSPDGVFVTDSRGNCLEASAIGCQMMGYTLGELREMNIADVVAPEEVPRIAAEVEKLQGGAIIRSQWKYCRKDGSTFLGEITAKRLSDGRLQAFVRDVTERELAERALRESEVRLNEAQRNARIGSWRYMPDGSGSWSDQMYDLFKLPRDVPPTREAVAKVIHPEDRAGNYTRAFVQALESGARDFETEYRLVWPDGQVRTVHSIGKINRDTDGRVIDAIGTVQDITERKLAERQLQESYVRLRVLATGLERAREAERTHIAREIHDELGQALTGLKMDLAWLRDRIPGKALGMRRRAIAMMELVDSTVDFVRRVAGELRPGVLDDLGLAAAVRWQAREFTKRSGLAVKVDVAEDVPLDGERATAVFRILQETLTNIARHARATTVTIRLGLEDGAVLLKVRDDGRGISAEQAEGSRSFGLLGMRERAEAWRATLDVRGVSNRGTVVTLRMPLELQQA